MARYSHRFDSKLKIMVPEAEKNSFNSYIRSLDVEHFKLPDNRNGAIKHIRIIFGHHHYVNIDVESDENGQRRVLFEVGATHHSFRCCASLVSGDLDEAINLLRETFPGNVKD